MQFFWVPLSRRIERGDSGAIQIDLFTPMNCGNSFRDQFADGFDHLVGIIIDQDIDKTLVITLLAAEYRPDERTISRIEFVYTGFFFDHFRTIEPKTAFRGHHDVTGDTGG